MDSNHLKTCTVNKVSEAFDWGLTQIHPASFISIPMVGKLAKQQKSTR